MTRDRTLALVLATVAFAVNFWAWGLLSPLAPVYRDLLGLTPIQVSVMVAVPVIVGSLGRIPLGVLTDRYGGRRMFAAVSFLGVIPVVFLAFATDYWALLAGGLALGVTGASFAIGIPFVNAWYPPGQRGLALGIFGMGNIGTAVAGFVAPPIAERWGRPAAFLTVAAALTLIGLAFLLLGRDASGTPAVAEPFGARFAAAARLRATWELAALYALTFGGFVAFGVYLPTYLKTSYELSTADAGARAAGFVVIATLARPVGGWLADRVGGTRVLRVVFAVLAACAAVTSTTPPMPLATVAFLTMAAALGLGNGAVFALLAERVPAARVGSATGMVGAAGGLGGFFPPLVMGLVYQATGGYTIGLLLLSATALAAFAYCVAGLGPRRPVPRAGVSAMS
ncbi:MFS transporter [Carbonactinospora thermoautotrophica]|uniref:MFS transporter n=2 Tax=Carbonactinospora thermoautotrophica TaxID=1469144 RepID=A0A132MIK6_9ACTN|nr:MFS transporter [Carbonactinospora thermoautotrophica]KWW97668.1 MFS transporter [Carbonactinospora thermoautotrophica]